MQTVKQSVIEWTNDQKHQIKNRLRVWAARVCLIKRNIYLFDRARIENKSVKSVIKFLIRSHSTEKEEKRFKYDIGV